MRRKILLILSCLLLIVIIFPLEGYLVQVKANEKNIDVMKNNNDTLFNNGLDEEWNKTFGGPRYDLGTDIQATTDGGYIFVGIRDAIFYDDGGDCGVIKIHEDGTIESEKTLGGINSEISSDVLITDGDGYIIVFTTRSFGLGDMDICIIKIDANGNEEWNRTYGGESQDQATSIQPTSDHGYIVTGMTKSVNNNEAWLFKIDQQGNLQWTKTYGNNDLTTEYFMEALQTNDGGFIAAGRDYLHNEANSDIYLVKTDANGDLEWDKRLGGPYPDGCLGITQTTDGNYILSGQSSQTQNAPEDISLFKIDNLGNEIWRRYYGGPYFDTGNSVIQCSDGGYLIAGEFSRNSYDTNAVILKTDSNGNKEWEKILGGTQSDGFLEMCQTTDNGFIFIGFTESYGAGDCDIWVVKCSAFENQPPNKPLRPSGHTSGNTNNEYSYATSTIDPEGDQVYYLWDWDDSTTSEWNGPYPSNVECNASHIWTSKGTYEIKVKAKDIFGAESPWSDPLPISMPYSDNPIQQFLEQFFQRSPNTFPLLRQIFGYKDIEIKEITESYVNTLDCKEKETLGSYDITWKKHVIDAAFDYAFGVFVCDVDNDTDCDILGAAKDGDFIAWWRNDGGNPINWTKFIIDDHFDGATSVFAVDIDGDHDVDVVGSAWHAQEIALWINTGGTPITWRKSIIKSGFDFAHEVYCYDLDKDGDMDIFGASSFDNQLVWWRNDGGDPISWIEQMISPDFNGAKSARVADFDDDGFLDVVGTAIYDNEIRWWRNAGGVPIMWEEHVVDDNFIGAHRVEPCDMDFDGDTDIVGAAYWGNELAWWRNDGGTPIRWTKQVITINFEGACIGLPVDIDEDGDIDVIGTAQQDNDVALFRNDGGTTFIWTKIIIDSSFFGAWPGFVYDIDGDGDIDIVAGASVADKLAWWESNLNQKPLKPEKPTGTASGKPGTEYVYSSRTTDPFNLDVYYLWDWGDGMISEWSGPYHSGEICNASHIWSNKGNYEIKVKAKNINDHESDWSDPSPITMPYSYNPMQRFLELLFQRFPHASPLLRYFIGY